MQSELRRRTEVFLGKRKPPFARGPYNIKCIETEEVLLLTNVDYNNANFYYEYYVKKYTTKTFQIIRKDTLTEEILKRNS
jgi:hypothetical protein